VERNQERGHPLTYRLGFGVRCRDPNGDRYLSPGEILSLERVEELENLRALCLEAQTEVMRLRRQLEKIHALASPERKEPAPIEPEPNEENAQ